jgi:hypothetical protein
MFASSKCFVPVHDSCPLIVASPDFIGVLTLPPAGEIAVPALFSAIRICRALQKPLGPKPNERPDFEGASTKPWFRKQQDCQAPF